MVGSAVRPEDLVYLGALARVRPRPYTPAMSTTTPAETEAPADPERDDREALGRAIAQARASAERGDLVDHDDVAAWLSDLERGIRRPPPRPR